jgi:hypothetical protein
MYFIFARQKRNYALNLPKKWKNYLIFGAITGLYKIKYDYYNSFKKPLFKIF